MIEAVEGSVGIIPAVLVFGGIWIIWALRNRLGDLAWHVRHLWYGRQIKRARALHPSSYPLNHVSFVISGLRDDLCGPYDQDDHA
jgi:hypothetical protein